MKKRKVLIEKNSGHKESFARPSVVSLRSVITGHQRRSQSMKSPSVQNLHNSNSSDKVTKVTDDRMVLPDEMQSSKTRFSSRNRSKETRSTSSSRLKSFPAEEIKKLDNSPMFTPEPIAAFIQQDPQANGTFYTNPFSKNNNGRGDAISIQLSPHQQSKLQNTYSTSQQQVVANHREICQTNPQSESLLTRRIASPERQAHRPFVPNIPQGAVVYDRSLRSSSAIINQPVITQIPSTLVAMPQMQGSSTDSHIVVGQNLNEPSAPDSQCQKQLVNDRNAVNNRQMFMQQQKQASIEQNTSAPLNDQTAGNCQNLYHAQFHAPFQQNLHQINQQTQQNYHQQMLPQGLNQMQSISNLQQHIRNNSVTHCGYYNQQLPIVPVFAQGMTSPQDMITNRMRSMQHNLPIHQQNLGYPVNFQPTWQQNHKWIQIANQNQQHLQPPSQWQYYYQTRDPTNFNQKNSGSQNQSNQSINLSQNQANYKPDQSSMETLREEKKTLQFTSDMIRDQELLVSTMRQQGIPEEVMRRQFAALLNEQKRQLAYIAQFQRNIPEEIKKTRLVRRRTEKDEKPEWMMHITPPRISYNDIERMKAQQKALNEQYLMNKSLENMNKIVADQQKNYHQSKKEEICSQELPQQMYGQVNPYQLWQTTNWPHRSDQISCGHTACYPYNHQQNASNNVCRPLNPTFKYAQYPYNMRYNPYFPHSEPQEVWSKEHNMNSLNPVDNQKMSMEPAYYYQQSMRNFQHEKPAETSSLLKMRVYKEIIRPQKRNNGLQDLDSIQKMLETMKDSRSRKGLEYLANLTKKKPIVKLNGIQGSHEIPEDMQQRPSIETHLQSQKRILANGLENGRNPNNPPLRILRPKKADEPLMIEYPRQKQSTRNYYNMQAEKENGMMEILQNQDALSHVQNESISYDRQNKPMTEGCHRNNNIIQYKGNVSPHYHQMQQYYLNEQNLQSHNGGQGDVACMQRPNAPDAMRIDRAGGDTGEKPNAEDAKRMGSVQAMQGTNAYSQPEIHETRTIGGITYLARKPECALNNHVVSPDKLIANGHV